MYLKLMVVTQLIAATLLIGATDSGKQHPDANQHVLGKLQLLSVENLRDDSGYLQYRLQFEFLNDGQRPVFVASSSVGNPFVGLEKCVPWSGQKLNLPHGYNLDAPRVRFKKVNPGDHFRFTDVMPSMSGWPRRDGFPVFGVMQAYVEVREIENAQGVRVSSDTFRLEWPDGVCPSGFWPDKAGQKCEW